MVIVIDNFKLKSFIIFVVQATDGIGSCEAYRTLSKIIEVCIGRFVFLICLLSKACCLFNEFYSQLLSCSGMVQEHSWFSSSQFPDLIDLLLGLKSPVDTATLRSRFDCFHLLMVHALKVRLLL